MLAVYTRNVLLNQATLVSLFAAMLLVPRFLVLPMSTTVPVGADWRMIGFTVIALVVAVFSMSKNMRNATAVATADGMSQAEIHNREPETNNGFFGTKWVQLSTVTCMLVAVVVGSMWFWRHCFHDPMLVSQRFRWWALAFFAGLSILLSSRGGFWKYAGRHISEAWRPRLQSGVHPGPGGCLRLRRPPFSVLVPGPHAVVENPGPARSLACRNLGTSAAVHGSGRSPASCRWGSWVWISPTRAANG